MRNTLFVLVIVTCILTTVSAKELKYPVSDIPAALKENAHTVYRVYKYDFEVKSSKSIIMNVTEARTILNKNAEMNSYFFQRYGPLYKVSDIKAKLYDALGKQVKTFGASDVDDHCLMSDYSLFQDDRLKYINPKYLNYPFTIEYSYQVEFRETMALPDWTLQANYTSYEAAELILKVPMDQTIKFKEYSMPVNVSKSTADNINTYSWKIKNAPAEISEPMHSPYKNTNPSVSFALENFELGNTKGSSKSWKDFGIWVETLLKAKDVVPESTVVELKNLITDCKTDREKVKLIYEFVQKKTRYVNIAVGIGGWEPFDAQVVDKCSYGDCKALSNYTKSLLNAVGIKAFYTLVRAGADEEMIDADFPSNQFNHAIVCVPFPSDTIWLECTNQRLPFGYNGDFTDDRDVLIVDGENSRLVHTNIYTANENCISRNAVVDITDVSSASALVNEQYKGLKYEDLLQPFLSDDDKKKKIITESISLPAFALKNFSLTEERSSIPVMKKMLDVELSNYLQRITSDVYLLPLNFDNKITNVPAKVRNRKSDMCIRRAFMENDTVIYKLPDNFSVTNLPEKSEIKTKFGKYTTFTTAEGKSIRYIRHFELNKGVFSPDEYSDFRDFIEQIATADAAVAGLKIN